jgi:hypothetical protein
MKPRYCRDSLAESSNQIMTELRFGSSQFKSFGIRVKYSGLLFHTCRRQETNISSPEGLFMTDSDFLCPTVTLLENH